MFQERHYSFLAKWLRDANMALYSDLDRNLVCYSLADWLARGNPNFNREKFLAASTVVDFKKKEVRKPMAKLISLNGKIYLVFRCEDDAIDALDNSEYLQLAYKSIVCFDGYNNALWLR